MNVNEVLLKLWAQREKNTIITDLDGNVVYVSRICDADPETVLKKLPLWTRMPTKWSSSISASEWNGAPSKATE